MIQISANNSAQSLSDLKSQLKSILGLFDPKSRIFYIDYPAHSNVGDLLINLGTEQFFLNYRVPIHERYSVLNIRNISDLKADEGTTFLCHGGGNFGDLYSEHESAREWLLDKFPRARIVFLPQSLYYSSEESQRVSLSKIARHSNCHVLVRDKESLDALRRSGITHSSMMPDMAHQLWGTLKTAPASKNENAMYFFRRDQEAAAVPAELGNVVASRSVDWSDIVSTPHRVLAGGVYSLLKSGARAFPARLNASAWYLARDTMINDAVAYFLNYETVYTNRLHAMLLALLLGRDVNAFDNSYGKLSRYINTWLAASAQPKGDNKSL